MLNRFIPTGAVKIADKLSDAVAHVWTNYRGEPCGMVFFGKQSKPIWHFRFRSPAEREKRIAETFTGRQASINAKTDRRAKTQAETHTLQVGHVLKSSWGYDQTNVDFYQVTAIISPKMVEIRKIGATATEALSSMSGKVVPMIDNFVGEPMRKRAGRGGIRIASYAHAYVWDGTPAYESSYH